MTPEMLDKLREFYAPIYLAYGQPEPTEETLKFLYQKQISDYALMIRLSKSKRFKDSPLWNAQVPGIKKAAADYLGPDDELDDEFLRLAVVQSWDEDFLLHRLREREDFRWSPKFKEEEAALLAAYQEIMGEIDQPMLAAVWEAVRGGWTRAQFARWLRNSAAYTHGREWAEKATVFARAMKEKH
jgi:hypothetical protein